MRYLHERYRPGPAAPLIWVRQPVVSEAPAAKDVRRLPAKQQTRSNPRLPGAPRAPGRNAASSRRMRACRYLIFPSDAALSTPPPSRQVPQPPPLGQPPVAVLSAATEMLADASLDP